MESRAGGLYRTNFQACLYNRYFVIVDSGFETKCFVAGTDEGSTVAKSPGEEEFCDLIGSGIFIFEERLLLKCYPGSLLPNPGLSN